MPSGFITSHINVAQLVLYAFWIFFAILVIYLRREDKREGYPLESDRSDRAPRVKVVGFPRPPAPKSYLLPHGQGVRQKPEPAVAPTPVAGAEPKAAWPGAPLVPTGDPMRDAVGPASYANRDDLPDLAISGKPKIVPMRIATDFHVEPTDPDPRGLAVVAADGKSVGTVVDLWVDRAEPRILYFEVALKGSESAETEVSDGINPLLPYGFARVKFGNKRIEVSSIMSHQFQHVPRTASADQITRLEEDKITAYFASGHLYAHPSRQRALI
ncbi:MAG: photosynthetic reaction center subunit H [Wenzhouxiangella sp.]|jgi:photosynthetic reaction center H subunit|nr:photosynthetic reaction center subunit H [Wenzhouxiangella sp.]